MTKDYKNYKASISWYYATSQGAEYFGYSKTGCYGLAFVNEKGERDLIASFLSEKEAYEYSDRLGMQYDRFDIREHKKTQIKT